MFSLITICIYLIYFLNVEAVRYGSRSYGNYQYPNAYNQRGSYQNNYYRTPYQYQRQYQGYRYPYYQQYQGYRPVYQQPYQAQYRSPYQYQAYQYQGYQYPGYGTYYQNTYYYPYTYAQSQSYNRGDRYIGNGIYVDSHGNGIIGSKESGICVFGLSRGCVGRG